MVADSVENLYGFVSDLGKVCEMRKLKVNVEKSKMIRCSISEGRKPLSIGLNGGKLEKSGWRNETGGVSQLE